MRQTELHLTDEDRELIESYRTKGLHQVREVNRAHVLSALDRGIPEAQIMAVLGIGRTVIWRTRAAYLESGAKYALHDVERPGKPRRYATDVEAKISALACSEPPLGARRWIIALLEQAARKQAAIGPISRETVRRMLKKTASNRKEAQALLRRVVFHYTPKHASWLNMAEIEIGILDRQRLDRRLPDRATLVAGVDAWQQCRNTAQRGIAWSFTRQDADARMARHHVSQLMC